MGGLGNLFDGGLTNSGSMPIAGGAATSGNGDSIFHANSDFGGLNFSTGISTTNLILAAVGVVVAITLINK